MKKIILLAVLLVGAGVAKSRAGVAFGINIDNGRGSFSGNYVSGEYSQQSYGYACPQPYGYGYSGSGYYDRAYSYGYNRHDALHHDSKHGKRHLHRDLKAQHRAGHRELRHQQQHRASPWALKAEHDGLHHGLNHQDQHGHADIRQQNRQAQYGYRW